MHSHHEGEVWGLATMEGKGKFITSGDDNKIMIWDIMQRKCTVINRIAATQTDAASKPPQRKIIGGASTLSSLPPDQQSRALAYLPSKEHLAVAHNDGVVTIRSIANAQNQVLCSLKDPREWCEVMDYSPKGDKLAVGSHDNNVYVYTVGDQKYTKYAVLKAH